jgi:hypothetical protein
METRAEASAQKQPPEEPLPKWKLKANWILRQYARIWCLKNNLHTINFEIAFKDVFIQFFFFLDEGLLEKDAEGCITFAYNEYHLTHGRYPAFLFLADKWEWIVKNGLFAFLKNKFLADDTIEKIFYVARYTEECLGDNEDFILCFPGPWIDYEHCLSLPCLPPRGHEWVDDPWARLGK